MVGRDTLNRARAVKTAGIHMSNHGTAIASLGQARDHLRNVVEHLLPRKPPHVWAAQYFDKCRSAISFTEIVRGLEPRRQVCERLQNRFPILRDINDGVATEAPVLAAAN